MKNLWSLIYIVILFLSFNRAVLAEESVQVMLNEAEPLAGETFQLIFKIKIEENETPDITFDSGGLEIIDKSNQGMSLRTVYMNGTLTTTREMTYVYEMMANRPQTYQITGIKVQTSSGTLRHQDITVRVVNEVKEKSPFFVRAEVSKQKAYVGEGILVTYYLYQNTDNLLTTEIKKFPTLNNFTKRFYDKQNQSETVNFNGAIYRRTNFYTAMLFPDTSGKLVIDPLSVAITYVTGQRLDPFGGLGFSFGGGGRKMARTLSSAPVTIDVLPLPNANVPPSFTGLVGKHSFKIATNKEKAIVNDPIEVKLIVEGPGALEKLNPPDIYKNPNLEEFDSQFDLETPQIGSGRKTFKLTYLGRSNLEIDARKMPLSYFDPEKGDYVTVELDIPGLKIAGGALASSSGGNDVTPEQTEEEVIPTVTDETSKTSPRVESTPQLLAPMFALTPIKSNFDKIVVLILSLCLLIVIFLYARSFRQGRTLIRPLTLEAYENMQKNGIKYGDFYRFIVMGLKIDHVDGLHDQIQKSKLTPAAKEYLCQVLDATERAEYLNGGKKVDLPFKKKYLDEVLRYSVEDENILKT